MRKLLAAAAFLLVSTAAQAQYTFEYGGRTIRIDPDRGTVSIPGVYDNTGEPRAKKAKKNDASRASSRRNRSRPIRRHRRPPPPRWHHRPPRRRLRRPQPRPLPRPRRRPRLRTAPRPRPRSCRRPPHRRRLPGPAADGSRSGSGPERRCRAACAAAGPRAVRRRCPGCACCGTGTRSQLAARHLAHRREGRQGPHRAVRQQPLRLLGRQQVEPERRTGPDQHEARQGPEMVRPHPRSQHRIDLRFDDRHERHRPPARAGLRVRRHVLRRPDLDAGKLSRHSQF